MGEQTVFAVKALEAGARGFPSRTLPIEAVLGPVRMLERDNIHPWHKLAVSVSPAAAAGKADPLGH